MTAWIIFVCIVATATALPYNGTCPSFGPMEKFNPLGMLGKWFCVYGAKHGMPEEDIRCVTNVYSMNLKTHSLDVELTQTNNLDNTTQTIYVPTKTVDSQFVPHAIIQGEMGEAAKPLTLYFTLMDTDYKNYMATVICGTDGLTYGYGVQAYSRQPTLSDEYLEKIHEVMAQRGIPTEMRPVEQNCDNKSDTLSGHFLTVLGTSLGGLGGLG